MTRFIPREKLGKKARRELDARQRRTWPCSPVMKTVESRKKYNRHVKLQIILAFGPVVRVVSPDDFTALIRERLNRQKKLQSGMFASFFP